MDNLTQPLLTDAKSSREIKSNQAIGHNKIVGSPDFIVSKTANGTQLKLNNRYKLGYSDIYNDWNPDVAWGIGDKVRVMPNTQYTSSTGWQVSASVGVWQCCANVPSKTVSDYLINNNLAQPKYQCYLRQSNPPVNYYPQWPEPANLAKMTDNPQEAVGRYWICIGTLPAYEVRDCNGQVYFIGAIPSGSLST